MPNQLLSLSTALAETAPNALASETALTLESLTPHSAEACRACGISPRELCSTEALEQKLVTVAEETHATDISTRNSKNVDLEKQRKMHVEKKRQAMLAAVIAKREYLVSKERSDKEKDRGNVSLDADLSLSPKTNALSLAAEEKLAALNRARLRQVKQFAEKQRRDLSLLLSAELRHATQEANDRAREDALTEKKRQGKMEVAAKRAQRKVKELWTTKRLQLQQKEFEEERKRVEARDLAEREALQQRQLQMDAQRRRLALEREKEKEAKLEALREAEERKKNERLINLAAKLKEIAVKNNARKGYHAEMQEVDDEFAQLGISWDAVITDDKSPQFSRVIAAQKRLEEFQAQCAQEAAERKRKIEEKNRKAAAAKAHFEELMAERMLKLEEKIQKLEETRQQREKRLEAESKYYAHKDAMRLQVKAKAAATEQRAERLAIDSWQAKLKLLREREEKLVKAREQRTQQSKIENYLHALDKVDHAIRMQKQVEYMRQTQVAKMQEVEIRREKLREQEEESRKKVIALKRASEQAKQETLKKFAKMKGKLQHGVDANSQAQLISQLGLDNESLSSPASTTKTKHKFGTSTVRITQKEKAVRLISQQAANKKCDVTSKKNSSKKLSVSAAGSASFINPTQNVDIELVNDAIREAEIQSLIVAEAQAEEESKGEEYDTNEKENESLQRKAAEIEKLSLEHSGQMLMLLEKEQEVEDQRTALAAALATEAKDNPTAQEDLDRLETMFAVERGVAAERLAEVKEQQEEEMKSKMKELGLVAADDDNTAEDPYADEEYDVMEDSFDTEEKEAEEPVAETKEQQHTTTREIYEESPEPATSGDKDVSTEEYHEDFE